MMLNYLQCARANWCCTEQSAAFCLKAFLCKTTSRLGKAFAAHLLLRKPQGVPYLTNFALVSHLKHGDLSLNYERLFPDMFERPTETHPVYLWMCWNKPVRQRIPGTSPGAQAWWGTAEAFWCRGLDAGTASAHIPVAALGSGLEWPDCLAQDPLESIALQL